MVAEDHEKPIETFQDMLDNDVEMMIFSGKEFQIAKATVHWHYVKIFTNRNTGGQVDGDF